MEQQAADWMRWWVDSGNMAQDLKAVAKNDNPETLIVNALQRRAARNKPPW
jgi:hypothetical protein